MAKKIYQVRITLKGSNPRIWRRLLVPSDLSLNDFHKVIQTSMGWTNSHLHQFVKNKTFYTVRSPEAEDFWYESNNVDYKGMVVSDLLKAENENIIYEYDFGDSWMHDVLLEKILPYDQKHQQPVCLDGAMNFPPEDVGGLPGFYQMLEALQDPQHEDYEEYMEWLGEIYDPEYFDREEINELLKEEDYGCIELE